VGLSARKIAGAGRGSGFAADESSYVNGAIVRADGGITIAPIA